MSYVTEKAEGFSEGAVKAMNKIFTVWMPLQNHEYFTTMNVVALK